MSKDAAHTRIPRLDGAATRIPLPSSISAISAATSQLAGGAGGALKPHPGHKQAAFTGGSGGGGVLGLRQQAAILLPKTLSTEKLCQVAQLVRNKTTSTLQSRFNFKQRPATVERHVEDEDQPMPMEVLASAVEQERAPTAAVAAASVISPSMVRSETFDCPPGEEDAALGDRTVTTRPTQLAIANGGEATFNLSQQLESTFDVQTSSPNPNQTQTRRAFSFGESLLLDTSASILNQSGASVPDTPVASNGGAGTARGLLRAKLKQSVQHRLEDNTFVKQNSSTPAAQDTSAVFDLTTMISSPVNQFESPVATSNATMAVASSTMIVAGRQLDLTKTMTTTPNGMGWNCTEVLAKANRTNDASDCSSNRTLMAEDQQMDFDDGTIFHAKSTNSQTITTGVRTPNDQPPQPTLKPSRLSIGLDLASEFTLDCSIDLCDVSVHSNSHAASSNQLNSPPSTTTSIPFRKQNSFEVDDSLGILTPDQMKEFLDSNVTNPNVTGPVGLGGMMLRFPDTAQHQHLRVDMTPSPEELPLDPVEPSTGGNGHLHAMDVTMSSADGADSTMTQMTSNRSIGSTDMLLLTDEPPSFSAAATPGDDGGHEQQLSQTDSESKTDAMTKSTGSKVSNSFITSVTSITSLDTGYQGDGEMSRPASRGAGVHSPSGGSGLANGGHPNVGGMGNGGGAGRLGHLPVSRGGSQEQAQQMHQHKLHQLQQQQQQHPANYQLPPIVPAAIDQIDEDMNDVPVVPRPPRTTDPMTDSDFFTESDADDVVQRGAAGDRRAQVIDGHLYGAGAAAGADVYVGQQHGGGGRPGQNAESMTEDSCMESSGIFTDVENRADDDLGQQRSVEREDSDDMSPDGSTDTIKSNQTEYNARGHGVGGALMTIPDEEPMLLNAGQCNMSDSTSSTINSRISDQMSIDHSCGTDDNHHHHQNRSPSQSAASGSSVAGSAAAVSKASSPSVSQSATTASATSSSSSAATSSSPSSSAASPGGLRDKRPSASAGANKPPLLATAAAMKKTAPTNTTLATTSAAARKHTKNEANTTLPTLLQHKKHELKRPASAATASASVGVAKGRQPAVAAAAAVSASSRQQSAKSYTSQHSSSSGGSSAVAAQSSSSAAASVASAPSPASSASNIAIGGGGPPTTANGATSTSGRKTTAAPNRWDAVMHKIEANKTAQRAKKYSDVKSKVTCGLTKGGVLSPSASGVLKRPVAEAATAAAAHSVAAAPLAAQKRRLFPSTAKRAHTTSKESSASDLSLSGGSTKLNASPARSTETRSAKKRDVRALSVSPSDLGPPSKSNGTVAKSTPNNGCSVAPPPSHQHPHAHPHPHQHHPTTAAATATNTTTTTTTKTATLQKRFASGSTVSTTTSNSTGTGSPGSQHSSGGSGAGSASGADEKCSPPAKKGLAKLGLSAKTPLKDHNRLVSTPTSPALKGAILGGHQHPHRSAPNAVCPSVATTNNNNSIHSPPNASNAPSLSSATLKSSALAASLQNSTSPPTGTAKVAATKSSASPTVVANIARSSSQNQHQNHVSARIAPVSSCDVAVDAVVAKVSVGVESIVLPMVSTSVAANLGCGGGDQCPGKGVEALGVLLQYLVFHMDAFGNAHWQKTSERTSKQLQLTAAHLDAEQARCAKLEQELLVGKQLMANKMEQAQSTELELNRRIAKLSSTENELREKVHASETEFGERLRAASMRERELADKVHALNRLLQTGGKEAEQRELLWQQKLALCQDELSVLRVRCTQSAQEAAEAQAAAAAAAAMQAHRSQSPQKEMQQQLKEPVPPPQLQQQHSINGSSGQLSQRMLQNEVESLRCVLELKQNEITELRKANAELVADAEALPGVTLKVHSLESRLEDLQLQLKRSCDEEKDLRGKLKHVEQCCTHETNNRKSMSLHNEQLKYKLMQNSQKYANTLTELSKHYPDQSDFLNAAKATLYGQENSSAHELSAELSGFAAGSASASGAANRTFGNPMSSSSFIASAADTDCSPPSTPVVKGVVEKNESVSWVLEINDEVSAEALASRIVRRAGSFRSNQSVDRWSGQQTPAKKRNTSAHSVNPLSQSASATSILRHYSDGCGSPVFRHKQVTAPGRGGGGTATATSRVRSKSVSQESPVPQQMSSPRERKLAKPAALVAGLDQWAETPIGASSPRRAAQVAEVNDLIRLDDEPESAAMTGRNRAQSLTPAASASASAAAFRRGPAVAAGSSSASASASSSAPSTSARSDLLLPTMAASMQDSPKFQQIKESAGEAMVSGTQSEDDDDDDDDDDVDVDVDVEEDVLSTGSSDESMSVSSGRTTNSSHSHFTSSGRGADEGAAAAAAAAGGAAKSGERLRRVSLEDVLMQDVEEAAAEAGAGPGSQSLDDNF